MLLDPVENLAKERIESLQSLTRFLGSNVRDRTERHIGHQSPGMTQGRIEASRVSLSFMGWVMIASAPPKAALSRRSSSFHLCGGSAKVFEAIVVSFRSWARFTTKVSASAQSRGQNADGRRAVRPIGQPKLGDHSRPPHTKAPVAESVQCRFERSPRLCARRSPIVATLDRVFDSFEDLHELRTLARRRGAGPPIADLLGRKAIALATRRKTNHLVFLDEVLLEKRTSSPRHQSRAGRPLSGTTRHDRRARAPRSRGLHPSRVCAAPNSRIQKPSDRADRPRLQK